MVHTCVPVWHVYISHLYIYIVRLPKIHIEITTYIVVVNALWLRQIYYCHERSNKNIKYTINCRVILSILVIYIHGACTCNMCLIWYVLCRQGTLYYSVL